MGDGAHGPDDLLPAAVVEGDDERQAGVALSGRLRVLNQAQDVGRQRVTVADDPDPDVVGVEIREVVADEELDQAEQVRDLLRRPAPVLGGEAVDREVADTELTGGAHGAADRLDAAAMTLDPRQSPPGGPAAVPVHDDGDMGRRADPDGVLGDGRG